MTYNDSFNLYSLVQPFIQKIPALRNSILLNLELKFSTNSDQLHYLTIQSLQIEHKPG